MSNPVFTNERSTRSLSEFDFVHDPNDKNSKLGTGSFASVKLAKEIKTGIKHAIKIISMDPIKTTSSDLHNIRTEITIHRKLNHPNIIKFHNYIQKDNKVYLVLDFAENGNLYSYMHKKKNLSPEEVFRYFYQSCLAIQYLHQNDVLHRDIKPENLLLDKDLNIKLCDFGWATRRITEKRLTFCGTYEYMAPEIVHKKPYDYRVDIWSLGILLYELLHREAPYKGRSLPEITKSLTKPEIAFKPSVSPDAKDLILKILKTSPNERLSIAQILSHPWVQAHLPSESDDSLQIEELKVSPREIKPVHFQSFYSETPRYQLRRDNTHFKSEILGVSENDIRSELFDSATRKNSSSFYSSFNIPATLKEKERERFKDITKERERREKEKEKTVIQDSLKSYSGMPTRNPLQEYASNSQQKILDENFYSARGHIKSSSSIANTILDKLVLDEKKISFELAKKKRIFENSILSPHFKTKVDSIVHQISSHTTTHKNTDSSISSIFARRALNLNQQNIQSSTVETPSSYFNDEYKRNFSQVINSIQIGKISTSNKSDDNDSCTTASSSATLRPKSEMENSKGHVLSNVKSSFHKKISLPKGDNCPKLSSPLSKTNLTTRSRFDTKISEIDQEYNFGLTLRHMNSEAANAKVLTTKNMGSVLSAADQNKYRSQGAHELNKAYKALDYKRKPVVKAPEEYVPVNLYLSALSERRNENKENKKDILKEKDNIGKLREEFVARWGC